MARSGVIISFFLLITLTACSNKQHNKIEEIPESAQEFIHQYFPNTEIAYIKEDRDWFNKDYEVVFTNGNKIIFDNDGQWKKIKSIAGKIPLVLIPPPIQNYLEKNNSGTGIISIEHEKHHYEVKLNNKLELKFDEKFNIIDIDN